MRKSRNGARFFTHCTTLQNRLFLVVFVKKVIHFVILYQLWEEKKLMYHTLHLLTGFSIHLIPQLISICLDFEFNVHVFWRERLSKRRSEAYRRGDTRPVGAAAGGSSRQIGQRQHQAHSQDMSHPERNGAAIPDSLVDAEISGEEGIRVDWEIDPMVFARCNLNLRLRQVLCFVCTIVKSVFACVANSPTPHLDVFSIYRLMDKLMVLIWNTMQ